jgi:phosphoribosyl-ATP pyrophosphohydrolase
MSSFGLADLAAIISARGNDASAESYTRSLLDGGPARAARKFGEEAVELIIAAIQGERRAIVGESADVLYHFLVLLHSRGVPLTEVLGELEGRTGQSGHQEKASRQSASR